METPTPEQVPTQPVVPTPTPVPPMPTTPPVPEQAPVWNTNIPFYQPQMAQQPSQANIEIKVDSPQVIEKIVYKKQRIHGFFRTLTIIALLVVGVLMLLENTWVMKLSLGNVNLDVIYPIFIIFSTIVIRSYRGIFGKLFWLILFLGVVGWFFGVSTYTSLNPSTKSKFGNYISYPATQATGMVLTKLNINTLVGNFDIKGTETKNLAEGTYKSDRNLLVTTGIKSNYDYLYLKEDPNWNLLQNYSSNLTLGISDTKIVDIYLKNMLWMHTIDLTDIKRANAKIHWWIQDLELTLWNQIFKDSQLEIQLVGGRITLTAPKDLGIKMYFKQWAWSLELTDFDIKGKDYFESKNLATAKKILNINISAWVTAFKFLWK